MLSLVEGTPHLAEWAQGTGAAWWGGTGTWGEARQQQSPVSSAQPRPPVLQPQEPHFDQVRCHHAAESRTFPCVSWGIGLSWEGGILAEALPFVLASGKLLSPEEEAAWVDAFGGVLCRDPCPVFWHTCNPLGLSAALPGWVPRAGGGRGGEAEPRKLLGVGALAVAGRQTEIDSN